MLATKTLLTIIVGAVLFCATSAVADLAKQREFTATHKAAGADVAARGVPQWEQWCGKDKNVHCLSIYGTTLTPPQFDHYAGQILASKSIPGGHIYAIKTGSSLHVRADCDSHDVYHKESSIAWVYFGKHTSVTVHHQKEGRKTGVLTGDLMDKPKAPKLKSDRMLQSWYPGVDLQLYCASKVE